LTDLAAEQVGVKKRRPTIRPEDFARFLAWLSPEPERQGEAWNLFHRKLTMYFTGRGCGIWASDLASEALERTAGKFADGGTIEDREPGPYLFQVAAYLLKEHFRNQKEAPLEPERVAAATSIDETAEMFCCKSCLRRLASDEQALLQDYFAGERQGESIRIREELATELGIAQGALRIKVFRLKQKLVQCITDCLDRNSSAGPISDR
jgi:DNA-directed RNA polymerase specialized sigma24 family protein